MEKGTKWVKITVTAADGTTREFDVKDGSSLHVGVSTDVKDDTIVNGMTWGNVGGLVLIQHSLQERIDKYLKSNPEEALALLLSKLTQ